MKLADQRGIRSSKWVPNEILHANDINFISEAMYTNLTALLASIARPDAFGENEDIVMQGFTLNHNNLLTCDFSDGIACSFSGYYLLDGTWGFVASAGDIFSIVKPVTQPVAFTTGGTFARIDLLEVRPIRTAYDSKSRQFKDPITGLVTSSPIDTKYEYGYEFAVREGDDTSALTKEQTTWTVNTATVGSDIAGKYVLFSTRSGDYYIWYNTGASGDPAVSGRTGIEVSINAGDDKDAIALAARTELNSHQLVTDGEIVISGATNQFIITVDYYVNVTDGTNGDMGSFFDAIAITQGNGVVYHTAGWIKIAEIAIGASATAITQNDILDVRDSDQWENESSGTRFIRWRAEEIRIKDAADRFTGEEVESALAEIAGSGRTVETVKDNADDLGTHKADAGNPHVVTRAQLDAMQNVFTTKGDILVRGTSIEERITAGLLDTILKGQGAGAKPIFERLALRDTGIKIGSNTRSVDGDQVITGVGFEASVILFLAVDTISANRNWSVGFDDGSISMCISSRIDGTIMERDTNKSLNVFRAAQDWIVGEITLKGADGFTITWGLTGSCQADFIYLCLP